MEACLCSHLTIKSFFFFPEDMRAKIVLGSNQLRGLTLAKAGNSQNTNLHV